VKDTPERAARLQQYKTAILDALTPLMGPGKLGALSIFGVLEHGDGLVKPFAIYGAISTQAQEEVEKLYTAKPGAIMTSIEDRPFVKRN
jgi:hypothetical protein